MAKTRLNATERRVIIRKIRKQVMDKYEKAKKKVYDSYVPSSNYKTVEEALSNLKDAFTTVDLKSYNYNYFGNLGYYDSENFGKRILNSIMDKDLENLIPSYPEFKDCEIDDELILKGLDKDWSVEKLIKSYVDGFKF